VKLLDRRKPDEKELAAVVERYEGALAERDEAAAALERAKAAHEERLGKLAQDLASDKLAVGEYEHRKADSERTLAEAETALARSEAVAEALAKRAEAFEQALAEQREAEVGAALAQAQAEVADLEGKLSTARRLAEELGGQLEDAVRATIEAGSRFHPERHRAAEARRRRDSRIAEWWAKYRPNALDEAPRHLRALAAEHRDRLKRENEEARERLRERARRQWAELGVGEDEIAHASSWHKFARVN
jgi:hypothetical protein